MSVQECPQRSFDEVSKSLDLAKLSMIDMKGGFSQSLFFHPEQNEDLVLIEADAHLLDEAANELIVRGDLDDDVVLCTGTRTYSVREAEISNSLLVVPHLKVATKNTERKSLNQVIDSKHVINTFHVYWEPKEIRPSARKLIRLLEPSEFRGEELETEVASNQLLTVKDLLGSVQSSSKQLDELLTTLPIVVYKGHVRLLSFEYHFRILEFILTSIESNSMDIGNIDSKTVTDEVSELEPKAIVEEVLRWYVKDSVLMKNKVSRTQAEALLRNGQAFKVEDFFETWKKSLPEGFEANLSDLSGISYIDDNNEQRPVIHYLSPWDLPESEAARFDVLLRMKRSWRLEEIEPFVNDLSLKGVNSLILKYARSFKKDGRILYAKK